jgi:hypothetical protein
MNTEELHRRTVANLQSIIADVVGKMAGLTAERDLLAQELAGERERQGATAPVEHGG